MPLPSLILGWVPLGPAVVTYTIPRSCWYALVNACKLQRAYLCVYLYTPSSILSTCRNLHIIFLTGWQLVPLCTHTAFVIGNSADVDKFLRPCFGEFQPTKIVFSCIFWITMNICFDGQCPSLHWSWAECRWVLLLSPTQYLGLVDTLLWMLVNYSGLICVFIYILHQAYYRHAGICTSSFLPDDNLCRCVLTDAFVTGISLDVD